MSNFNVVAIQGNLVADPEFFGEEGTVARFTVANNTGFGDNQETNYVDCVAFGKQVDTIRNHFAKGKQIIVRGKLIQSRWEDKTTGDKRSKLEIRLDNYEGFSFVSGGRRDGDEVGEPVPAAAGEPVAVGEDGKKLF